MRLIGLTGGTGSGKTTAARRFVERGIPVIDADAVGHEVIAPGGSAEQAVLDAFGDGILTANAIDRTKLGRIVFGDHKARVKLNAIVHPAIRDLIIERSKALRDIGHRVVLVDAALLGEGETLEDYIDGLILVLASAEKRTERLVTQRGLSEIEVRRRMDSQIDPERKRRLADWIIENDGTMEALHARVDSIVQELRTGVA